MKLVHFICQGILRSIQKSLYNNQKLILNPQRPHTLLLGASKQFSLTSDAVAVESSAFNTLSSTPSALSNEYASVVTDNEGRRRETLSDQSRVANWDGFVVNGCHIKLN